MALLYGLRGGASVVASEPAPTAYDPVYSERLEGPFFWKVLDDYYSLSTDRDVIEAYWSALLEVSSGDLLRTYTDDATTCLATTPIHSQRRWVSFDLTREVDFKEAPGLVDEGAPLSFAWDSTYETGDYPGALSGTWQNKLGTDRTCVALRASLDDGASLAWSFRWMFSEAQRGAFSLVGYSGPHLDGKNSVLAGFLRPPAEAGNVVRACLVHVGTSGEFVFGTNGADLQPGRDYRADARYVAATRTMTLDVYDMAATRYSTSAGYTGEFSGALPQTNTLRVSGADLAALGVRVGDVVGFEERSSPVTSVEGDTLSTRGYLFPTEATGLSITVVGPTLVAGVALPVGTLTSDFGHTVDRFGATTLDFSHITTALDAAPDRYVRAYLKGTTWAWTFSDPTSPHAIAVLPLLQDKVTNPTETWALGADFHLNRHASGTTFEFTNVPSSTVWAEYVAYDERLIEKVYGENIGLVGDSSEDYLTRVRGLYFSYYRGPTRGALKSGVHLLLGLPVAEAEGTVEEVDDAYSSTLSRIRVSGRDYTYPTSVGTSLHVGDSVTQFQPLCGGVTISDWKTAPGWWDRHVGLTEIQKYHTFDVTVDAIAVETGELALSLSFLGNLSPTWKSPHLTVQVNSYDVEEVTDDLALAFGLDLWDTSGDSLIPRYDSHDYSPYVTDWRYDQLESVVELRGWTTAAGIQRHPRYTGVRDYLTDLSGVWDLVNGLSGASGNVDAAAEVEVGVGAVAFKYAVAARLLSGTAGGAAAGSSTLTDPTLNAFDEVVLGAVLSIGAEAFWVVAVDAGAGTVEVEGSFGTDYVAASWEILNPAAYLSRIDSTSSAADLTFIAPFAGPSGSYVLSLVDRKVTNAYYDQQDETNPEEELVFVAHLSHGYGLTGGPLSGPVAAADGSNTLTGTNFIAEVAPIGGVSGLHLLDGSGRWYQIGAVNSDTSLAFAPSPSPAIVASPAWVVESLPGTFDFTGGNATVTCTDDLTGLLSIGDWFQNTGVNLLGPTPLVDNPIVLVQNIVYGAPTTITLTAAYTGVTDLGTWAVHRGADAAIFPLPQNLPIGRNPSDVTALDFAAFREAAGSEISSTVAEP